MSSRRTFVAVAGLLATVANVGTTAVWAFQSSCSRSAFRARRLKLFASSTAAATIADYSFIDNELRSAAMKLHTRSQAPKEGRAAETEHVPHTPTRADYLRFLVDSQHVFAALEDIVNAHDELVELQNTGLERVAPLERDIDFMTTTYDLERPNIGTPGTKYAQTLRDAVQRSIPQFMCHYYNFYFAHTAGGRMIGKQMSALLLDKKTLDFYKWDGDLNDIKSRVKGTIERMALRWSDDEKAQCVDATAAAFAGGGAINSYLSNGPQSAY